MFNWSLIVGVALFASGFVFAGTYGGNRYDDYDLYRKTLNEAHLDGRTSEAVRRTKKLMERVPTNSTLHLDMARTVAQLDEPEFDLERGKLFVTGVKTEVYCRDQGLVYLKMKHNDGTASTVKLTRSDRKMDPKAPYTVMTGGSWEYEVDTEYREPVRSNSWMRFGDSKHYRLRERRELGKKKIDEGRWTGWWTDKGHSHSFHTQGDVKEPMPVFLGNDFHMLGVNDLGIRLKMRVGAKDTSESVETGAEKKIALKNKRTVTQKLDRFDYSDSMGKTYGYADCFEVVTKVAFNGYREYNREKK